MIKGINSCSLIRLATINIFYYIISIFLINFVYFEDTIINLLNLDNKLEFKYILQYRIKI